MDKTVVINLISGPGAGKSTAMAGLFYALKKIGVNCEMAPEFAKEKVYEESYRTMDDQMYIFAKQLHKLNRLVGKVDIIITDGSLLNSYVYGEDNEIFHELVRQQFDRFENVVFFIERTFDKYDTHGRIESADESKELDKKYIDVLETNEIPYERVRNIDAADYIMKRLYEKGIL